MKNWKFIKVGNGIEISGVIGKLPPDSEISKTIYEELKKNNYDKDKTVLSLSIKYKVMPNARMFFEDAVEKVIKSYKNRTVNESINKQEWSMFKCLTKKAEEEVGNELPTEQDLKNWIRMSQQDMKDAQREMEKNKPLGHPDSYREENYGRAKVKYDEAAKAIKKMEEELRQGKYKKVGNSYTPNPELIKILEAWLHNRMSEQEARSKIMKITGDKNITDMMIHSPGGFIPAGNKKVGNSDTVSEYNAEIQRLTKKAEQLRRMGQGRSAMEIEKQIEKLGREMRELGNKKTGNKVIAGDYYDVVMSGSHFYIYKNGGSQIIGPFNSEQEAQKKIDAIENERQKTGNAIPGSIASIGPAWMYGGTVYGKMDTDESGKKHNEYVKITWLGSDKGGVANYFIDDKMQSDKFGSLDKNELKRWAEQKIGNETLCQWAKAKPRIINGTWEEPRKMPFQEKSLRYAYEKAKSKGLSGKKLEDEMLRIVSTTPHESSANEQEKRNDVNKWILRNGVSSDFVNNLKRARNAMVKNAMSVSDLERRIKENEKYIRSLQGKTVDGDGWPAKDAIQEAQDEIDMMKSRIAELTNQGNKKVGNLDHVEEGDYVSVRYQGEIVDGVVRKIQGTQALVTIDNTDVWFPIRSLKEST